MKEQVHGSNVRPFFVYGTLRPGHGNSRLWHDRAGAAWDGRCYVLGYKLITCGFPYLVRASTAQTTGCLITPHEGKAADVRRRFDALEGYPHHYDRIVVPVITPNGPLRAWTYVPADTADPYLLTLPECAINGEGFYDFNETRQEARR